MLCLRQCLTDRQMLSRSSAYSGAYCLYLHYYACSQDCFIRANVRFYTFQSPWKSIPITVDTLEKILAASDHL